MAQLQPGINFEPPILDQDQEGPCPIVLDASLGIAYPPALPVPKVLKRHPYHG